METSHPDWVPIIEMRFFAGFTADETAEALDIPLRTMERRFGDARRWLFVAGLDPFNFAVESGLAHDPVVEEARRPRGR